MIFRENNSSSKEYKGYDIVTDTFFYIKYEYGQIIEKQTYDTFEDYYNNIPTSIYTNACYAFYDFQMDKDFIIKNNININKLTQNVSFNDKSIKEWQLLPSSKEIDLYNKIEQQLKQHRKWIEKFLSASTEKEFDSLYKKYSKSTIIGKLSEFDIMDIYLFSNSEKYYDIIASKLIYNYIKREDIYKLCIFYDSDRLIKTLSENETDRNATYYKKRKLFKEFKEDIKNGNNLRTKEGFDQNTHFFYIKIYNYCFHIATHWFLTFEDFKSYLKSNLSFTKLGYAYHITLEDLKGCDTYGATLPFTLYKKYTENVEKYYDSYNNFVVKKEILSLDGNIIRDFQYKTNYLADYVHFLNNDLSNGEFYNLHLPLDIYKKYGIITKNAILYDEKTEKLEYSKAHNISNTFLPMVKDIETTLAISDDTHTITASNLECGLEIHYSSDLHIDFKVFNECSTFREQNEWLDSNLNFEASYKNLLLIGGDISSDFSLYKEAVSRIVKRTYRTIFLLGNHEYWNFQGKTITEIVNTYKKTLEDAVREFNGYGKAYLLHNNLLYQDLDNNIIEISTDKLITETPEQIYERVKNSNLLIFGGTGFSGCNQEFNANDGLYKNTISREQEIAESIFFEKLYKKLIPVFEKKPTIIFTHMPMRDWSKDTYHQDFYYLSGHTHKNTFLDDGCYHVYEDAQSGYGGKIREEYFIMDKDYDYFEDYKDGIHEISVEDYENFNKAIHNNVGEFKRDVDALYMLKKNGYYCFIFRGWKNYKTGKFNDKLYILNSKGPKTLTESNNPKYYWDRMDKVISIIQEPLSKYTTFQKIIANEIRKIGGEGIIHGCIIDIDFFNHIYVNPVDLTVTPYWARDMIDKVIYPSVKALLQDKTPMLYLNYETQIKKDKNSLTKISAEQQNKKTIRYLSTDIYKASREIKKMQKLYKKVLSYWPENIDYDKTKKISLKTSHLIKQ